jgi:hypothetical protein
MCFHGAFDVLEGRRHMLSGAAKGKYDIQSALSLREFREVVWPWNRGFDEGGRRTPFKRRGRCILFTLFASTRLLSAIFCLCGNARSGRKY